ncbi:M13 family metallopeptidase [Aureibacter tunicatorum]|uniref:Endopeptidase n=1 Tax=Aureibacter tunicatorum TaxID=866807 RepID=A0AAE4BT31_9BACT|nr:M13 family metallopeptidase [Aureibacter tunicatorum]MDR6240371.1 putative endopeptidase [Aureibacter tunicatorum]BDD05748.1 endothelin-converting protein [Aureibacter tunicatorum]
MKSKYLLVALGCSVSVSMLAGCQGGENKNQMEQQSEHGIETQYMDKKVYPGENFYKFVNGKWDEETQIPADMSRWGSFNELIESNNDKLKHVIETAIDSKSYALDTDQGKALLMYQTGLDTTRIQKEGLMPLQKLLKQIETIKGKEDLPKVLAELHSEGVSGFFGDYVYQDKKNSSEMTVYVAGGGLGLPDRDYYLLPKYADVLDQYKEHIVKMFELSGYNTQKAQLAANGIVKLETSLAESMLSRVERRDPTKTYHKMSEKELQALAESFNFNEYFKTSGFDDIPYYIVEQPKYMAAFDQILRETDLNHVQDYLLWNAISAAAPFLTEELVYQNWEFYSKTMRGAKEMRPRWKRVLGTVNGSVGFAIGKVYVEEVFPPEAKQKALEMVENIEEAFKERIKQLDWMGDSTKQKALHKLASFRVKIGYPDKWENYHKLKLDSADSYLDMVLKSAKLAHEKNVAELYKPVDKTKWHMTPQTVNAYYSPINNEIVFPAAILQPPFYDYQADDAVNYGGIGAVIGHEMTHGFDDQGRRYDAQGNLKNWWTEEDLEKFNKKAEVLVKQFDAYVVLDSLHVNGKLTLGENIADLGGVTLAHQALINKMSDEQLKEKIQGFTPEERLFISWATIWRTKYRPKALEQTLLTDVHSPGMIRAFAPLSNLESFKEAFHLKDGDPMVRPASERAKIW